MTFEQYCELVALTNHQHPEWRRGQTLFNVLWDIRWELAVEVRTSELDPFYKDSVIDAFLDFVREAW